MMINKHFTFYVRSNWPTKVLSIVEDNPTIFSPNREIDAVDEFGLGRVMIKALRYWSVAMGLTVEGKDQGMIEHTPTELYGILKRVDKYLQKIGSILLLHRNLVSNSEYATTWYWAFNEFKRNEFTKEEFNESLSLFLALNGMTIAVKSIEKDFLCFKQSYLAENDMDINLTTIEDDISSFFAPLGLIKLQNKNAYIKCTPADECLPSEIVYYCILKDNENYLVNNKQLDIEKLSNEKLQIGSYLNLSYSSLMKVLQKLENKDYIRIHNRFGNKHIEVLNTNCNKILTSYYGETVDNEI